jgi:hypothetical protein
VASFSFSSRPTATTYKHVNSVPSSSWEVEVALWGSLVAPAHWPLSLQYLTSSRPGVEASPLGTFMGQGSTSFAQLPSVHDNMSAVATSTSMGTFTIFSSVGNPGTGLSFRASLTWSFCTVSSRDGHEGHAGRDTNQRKLKVPRVRFLSFRNDQILSSGTKLGSTSHTNGIQLPSHTYRDDDSRQFLVQALLSGVSAPPWPDRDDPVVAAKVARTCEITEEGVSPIFPLTHVECSSYPSWSEIAYIGRPHLGMSPDGPVSTRGYFN